MLKFLTYSISNNNFFRRKTLELILHSIAISMLQTFVELFKRLFLKRLSSRTLFSRQIRSSYDERDCNGTYCFLITFFLVYFFTFS